MKNLKLLLLTLFSVLSLSVFSQIQLTTTQTSGPNICDGTASIDSASVVQSSIFWGGMGAIINQGSYTIAGLCTGTYTVTFTPIGGTSTTLTFTITSGVTNPCLGFTGFTTPTNSLDSTTCDGIITATVTGGMSPYTYMWSQGSTTQTIGNLCPGNYCLNVVDANGCQLTLCDSIGVQTVIGDTLIITGNSCQFPVDTIFTQVENCNFNFNAVDSAYLSYVNLPANPNGSMTINWTFIDTNGVITWMDSYAPMVNVDGCYEFILTLFCSQKSPNIKTIIVTDAWALFVTSGVDELSMNQRKLIKVIDMMGRTTELTNNRLLIKCYSDGTTEKVFINE